MPYTTEQLDRIVSRVVDRVEPVVPYSARTLTVDCRQLLEWSVRREPEAPFHPVRVFSEQNISEFVRSRSRSLKDSSRSNLRSRLRRVAEVMAPPRLPAEVERFEPADPRQPYTTKRELDRRCVRTPTRAYVVGSPPRSRSAGFRDVGQVAT